MLNSNTVNWNFHLIQIFGQIVDAILSFYVQNAWLIKTQLIKFH